MLSPLFQIEIRNLDISYNEDKDKIVSANYGRKFIVHKSFLIILKKYFHPSNTGTIYATTFLITRQNKKFDMVFRVVKKMS